MDQISAPNRFLKTLVLLFASLCCVSLAQAVEQNVQAGPQAKPVAATQKAKPAAIAPQAKPITTVPQAKPAAATPQVQPALSPQAKAAAVASAPFDHTKTGFILRDVHTTLRCEQCHVDAIFKNTPKDCGGCHSLGSRVGATPKPVNHVQTTLACDTCHTSPTSFLVRHFNHPGIVNGCSTCHNGQSLGVVSRPANHFPTALPCENCHNNTNTFLSARMDHTGITARCDSCHGGQSPTVVSKPMAHIPVTPPTDCVACHNTTTFLGATYNHPGAVAGICGTCHGVQPGVRAKPANHIPTLATGNACDACHTQTNTGNYTSFLGATYHSAVTAPSPVGICSTCHTGAYPNVQGKSFLPTHVITSAECDTCHTAATTMNYTTFLGATFNHAGAGITSTNALPPAVNACARCHNGVSALTYVQPHAVVNTATTACDSCHTTALATQSWLGATINHAAMAGYPAPCANCHNGVNAKGKPATHLVTTGACDGCHTNSINTLSWLGATGMNHAANPLVAGTVSVATATGNCAKCHNGSIAKGVSVGHIPVGSLSCDSGGCHVVGGAVTFNPGLMGAAQHPQLAATRCYTCHNGSYISQGLALGGAIAMPGNHIPITITGGVGGLECTTCHTPTYGVGAAGWLPEKMNHNGAQGMGAPIYCVTCHLTGTAYLGTMQRKSHNGSSTAKDCSSASCHKPLGKTGTVYKSWP